MVTVAEADELLRRHIQVREPVTVDLDHATGRILREDVTADRNYPPFDRVAMDGIALRYGAWLSGRRDFKVAGTHQAGVPAPTLVDETKCFEVMTGAALPQGCDTVVRFEDLEIEDGVAHVTTATIVTENQNVHREGDDTRSGSPVLTSGIRIAAPEVAVLASMGKASVRVSPVLQVSMLSTGDELVEVGTPVLPHQIRRSNSHAVKSALEERKLGMVRMKHVADTKESVRRALIEALGSPDAASDVIVLSGGVSMGRYDFVPQVLEELGVKKVFHRVTQKPGKPLWFGVTADGRPVFGLPGNPVATLVCLYRYVVPHLEASLGRTQKNRPTAIIGYVKPLKNRFTHFVGVQLSGAKAEPLKTNGSGDFLSIAGSDGFVELAPDDKPGPVSFYPWSIL